MIEFPEKFNMSSYFLDQNLAAGRGGKVCVRYRDREFTYAEIVSTSNRMGNLLRDFGVEMEDRVLIVLPDCPEFVAAWFGVAKIGGVIAMLNTTLSAREYKSYLDYTRAKTAIVHDGALAEFAVATKTAHHLRTLFIPGHSPPSA